MWIVNVRSALALIIRRLCLDNEVNLSWKVGYDTIEEAKQSTILEINPSQLLASQCI